MTPRRKNAPPTPTDLPCRICQGPGALTSGALNGLPEGVPACGTCREAIENRQVGVTIDAAGSLSIIDGRHPDLGDIVRGQAELDDAAGAPTHGPGPYCTATYEVYSCTMTEEHEGAHEAIDPDTGEVLATWAQDVAAPEPAPQCESTLDDPTWGLLPCLGIAGHEGDHRGEYKGGPISWHNDDRPTAPEPPAEAEVTVDQSKPAGEQAEATNDHPMSAAIAQGVNKAAVAPGTVTVLAEDWDRVMLLLGSVEEARSENNDAKEHAAATKKTLEKAQESLERALDRVRSGVSAAPDPQLPFDGPQAPPEPPGTPEPSPDGLPFDGIHQSDVVHETVATTAAEQPDASVPPLMDEDVTGQHIIDDANAALDAGAAAEEQRRLKRLQTSAWLIERGWKHCDPAYCDRYDEPTLDALLAWASGDTDIPAVPGPWDDSPETTGAV